MIALCPAAVSSMVCHGRRLLEQLQPGAQQKFGFHLPPFNGVSHLQLSLLGRGAE